MEGDISYLLMLFLVWFLLNLDGAVVLILSIANSNNSCFKRDDSFIQVFFFFFHQVHRRALNPTFNNKILLGFIPTFNRKANILVKQLEGYVGRSFDIYRPFYKLFTDTLVNTALDTDWELQTDYGGFM